MNEIIKSLRNHRSIRRYTDEDITDEQLQAIIDAVQAAPSSIGGQQVTVIAIKDKEKQVKLANYAGGQPYIADAPIFLLFCADFNRARIACEMNGLKMKVQDCVEAILVGAVDVGIALGFGTVAAESLGLGTVIIGAIRGSIIQVAEMAELPEYVFPVAGLVIGHPSDWSKLKPRLPKEAVFHHGKYNRHIKAYIQEYDDYYYGYVDQRGGDPYTWSSRIAATYSKEYYLGVRPLLERQGFKLE